MKKTKIIISIMILTVLLNTTVFGYDIIIKETNFKYECGIKVVKDNTIITNKLFINIPIGIAIWSSHNTIFNCIFINCDDEGIVLLSSNNNTIRNCIFWNCCDGIELQISSNNTIINCNFISNYHAGIDAIHHSNNNNKIINCVFYNSLFGTYFKESINNDYTNCQFIDNKFDMEERQ